jgi:acyl-CoA oxidase
VGDIGPKYGFSTNPNGYVRFSNVRIPKSSLLSKYNELSDDGAFVKKGNEKISYATMVGIRVGILGTCFYYSALAATIVVRYSNVRK